MSLGTNGHVMMFKGWEIFRHLLIVSHTLAVESCSHFELFISHAKDLEVVPVIRLFHTSALHGSVVVCPHVIVLVVQGHQSWQIVHVDAVVVGKHTLVARHHLPGTVRRQVREDVPPHCCTKA